MKVCFKKRAPIARGPVEYKVNFYLLTVVISRKDTS